ncbi:MAG: hypothetical protein H6Q20_200 [Bacteroidetes bacterium]|nr:hypothetical protein [Bacteroidota bacterium]
MRTKIKNFIQWTLFITLVIAFILLVIGAIFSFNF